MVVADSLPPERGEIPWTAEEFGLMVGAVNELGRTAPAGTQNAIAAHLFFARYAHSPLTGAAHLDRFFKILHFVDEYAQELLEMSLVVQDARGRIGVTDVLMQVLVRVKYDRLVRCRQKPGEHTFELDWILSEVRAATPLTYVSGSPSMEEDPTR